MTHIEVNQQIKQHQQKLQTIGTGLLEMAARFGANTTTRETLKGQIEHLAENFLFVIVGEVNIGKSSFVNSLLEAPICATGSAITTQDVQKITYGPEGQSEEDAYKRITNRTFPAEILKEITIVDTPGTNSRELDHQLITEKFIPHSNLVVFVFMPTSIHVESAWELFRKIKGDWSKKVIFVLTQADRYRPEEMEDYIKQLHNYAKDEGLDNPTIFATSSYLEEQGEKEKSGFANVRTFVNEEVLERAAVDKVKDHIKTFQKLLGSIDEEFNIKKEKFEKDQDSRQKIDDIIASKETLATSNIHNLTTKCLQSYDQNTEQTTKELKAGIGFFSLTLKSIRSLFGGESTADWLKRLNESHISRLNEDINQVLDNGISNIKSDIQYMVVGVKNELDQLSEQKIKSSEMFARMDEKRNELVQSLKTNLTDFVEKSPVFRGESITKGSLDYSSVNVAGGVAAIGTTIAMISQASVLDITGGIATALGLLVAGGLATTQKGKYLRHAKATFDEHRQRLSEDLEGNLKSYVESIKDQIQHQFKDFDHHLAEEQAQIKAYETDARVLRNELGELERKV